MVVLRFKRMGRIHSPFYRLGAMDKRSPRDGRVIEQLGWYSPTAPEGKQMDLKVDRIRHWLSLGAQPSATAASLMRKVGVDPTPGKAVEPTPAATPAAATPASTLAAD